jgi:GNAT superfamily N-acetyltransferase
MNNAATSYKIRGIAPPDLADQPANVRKMYWQWVVDYGLKRKDKELAAGLNKDGGPLRPISPETRKYRRSAMTASGKGDPSAPPLTPGRQLSRTRSLLAGRALSTHAEFYWRFDAFTGDSWGVVLAVQATRGRDVFGLSPAGTAWVQAQALKRWEAYRMGAHRETAKVMERLPAVVPQIGHPVTRHATFGIGATPDLTRGRWTGGMSVGEMRAHFLEPAGVAIPGRPAGTYNRLLESVWGKAGPKSGPAGAAILGAPRGKPPRPAKQVVATAPKPPPPPPRFGESRAKVYMDDSARAKAKEVFGRDISPAKLASITGAPDDAVVRVVHDIFEGTLELEVEHPKFEVMRRTVRNEGGKVIIHNDIFKLHPKYQGTSLGAEVFGRQAEQASELGVSHLETQAYRRRGETYVDVDGNVKEKWAGYYVWPGYGYDGPLTDEQRARLQISRLPAHLKAATHIRELYADPAAKAWWKEEGSPIDVEFDLKPGSYSMETLADLLKKKRSGAK